VFRSQQYCSASRCRGCDGYNALLTGTAFEKPYQRPATLFLLRRGIAQGEASARVTRELGISRKRRHTLRQRVQTHLDDMVPTDVMTGTAFEADELYQMAWEKTHAPRHPWNPPRRRAKQRKGHSTCANDCPPSSASLRATQVSSAFEWVTTRTGRRAVASSLILMCQHFSGHKSSRVFKGCSSRSGAR
jgi:hypothetical protein